MRYDGVASKSTKFRNGNNKILDFFSFFEEKKFGFNYEFSFGEVSFGPFSKTTVHSY